MASNNKRQRRGTKQSGKTHNSKIDYPEVKTFEDIVNKYSCVEPSEELIYVFQCECAVSGIYLHLDFHDIYALLRSL